MPWPDAVAASVAPRDGLSRQPSASKLPPAPPQQVVVPQLAPAPRFFAACRHFPQVAWFAPAAAHGAPVQLQWPVAQAPAPVYTYSDPPREGGPAAYNYAEPPRGTPPHPMAPETAPRPDAHHGDAPTATPQIGEFNTSRSAEAASKAAAESCCLDEDVKHFLQKLNFSMYAEAFRASGFDSMVSVVGMEKEHMQQLGILPGHIVKLEWAIAQIRARYWVSPSGSPPLALRANDGDTETKALAALTDTGTAVAALAAAVMPGRLRCEQQQQPALVLSPPTARMPVLTTFFDVFRTSKEVPATTAVSLHSNASDISDAHTGQSCVMQSAGPTAVKEQDSGSRASDGGRDANGYSFALPTVRSKLMSPDGAAEAALRTIPASYTAEDSPPPATLPPQLQQPTPSPRGSRSQTLLPPTAVVMQPGLPVTSRSSGGLLHGVPSPTARRVVVGQGSAAIPIEGMSSDVSPDRRSGNSVSLAPGDSRPRQNSQPPPQPRRQASVSVSQVSVSQVPPTIDTDGSPAQYGYAYGHCDSSSTARTPWARGSPTESSMTGSSHTVSASNWASQRDRLLAAKQQQKQLAQAAKTMTGTIATDKQLTAWLRGHGCFNVNSEKKGMLRTSYPLHVAVEENDPGMIRLLIVAGAQTKRTDSSGRTPLQLAERRNKKGSHDKVIEVLRNAHMLRPKPGPGSGSGSSDTPSREPSLVSIAVP